MERSRPNRRSVLKTIGATGAASSFLPGTGGAKSPREEKPIDVSKLTGTEREELVLSVQSNAEVKDLQHHLGQKDWSPEYSNLKSARRVSESDEEYEFGVLPFTSDRRPHSQAVILWKGYNNGSEDATAYILDQTDNEIGKERVITSNSGRINKNATRTDEITVECECLDPGGGECVFFHDEYCEDFNLSCIAWLVAAIGLGCGSSGLVLCLMAAGVEVGAYLTDDACEICDEYGEETRALC